jgi:molybdopterin synthase catalytic subunit
MLWEQIHRLLPDDPECGSHLLFVGTTRRWTDGRETASLFYEAYEPMATRELRILAEGACEKWPLRHLAIVHALGEVAVGAPSVAVIASSPHRPACMEAVPWLMDQLKQHVPIWKQERSNAGQAQWQHPRPNAPDA